MSEKLDVIYVSYSGDFILFAGWDNAVHQFLSGFCEGPKLFEIAECFILFARGVSPPSEILFQHFSFSHRRAFLQRHGQMIISGFISFLLCFYFFPPIAGTQNRAIYPAQEFGSSKGLERSCSTPKGLISTTDTRSANFFKSVS